MIIEVTGNKYNVGCRRGYGVDIPNLEFKLNLIIDRKRSTWPEPKDTRSDEEKEKGIPAPILKDEDKEIHEGDVFLLDGTVFAVDHDRLVQVISETGPLAFDRIYNSIIKPEIEFSYFEDEDNDYEWEEIEKLPKDIGELKEYIPPYEWMKIWQENFVLDRNFRPDYTIKVSLTDNFIGYTREIYMKATKVYYTEAQFSEEEVQYYLKKIMAYFYAEVGRYYKPTQKTLTLENIEND